MTGGSGTNIFSSLMNFEKKGTGTVCGIAIILRLPISCRSSCVARRPPEYRHS
jgi:hypothetical protein